MANFQARKITELSLVEIMSDCSTGGDSFVNSGVEFLRLFNSHASAHYNITITPHIASVSTSLHGTTTKAATVITLEDGETAYVGPFKQGVWSNNEGKVSLTYLTTGGAAISTISSGAHALKAELLYLDPK